MGRRSLVEAAGWAVGCSVLLPLAAAAQAAEQPSTADWIFRWLNFVVVFGVGGFYAWRKLKPVVGRRAEQISTTIAEAEAAQRAAQERLRAAEAKLAGVEREAAAMRERAKRDSAAEAKRVRALAREESARLERAADAEIAAAERAAVSRLREMAIQMTLGRARAALAAQLTLASDEWLVRRFVEELGTLEVES